MSSDPSVEDLHRNYRRGTFGRRLGAGRRPALVLVDVCEAYLDPASPLDAGAAAHAAAEGCRALLGRARQIGTPVVHTRLDLGGPDRGVLFRRKIPALELFATPGRLTEPPPGLEPVDGEHVVTKAGASAFHGTGLADLLARLEVDTLVIGGFSTSGCVRATAVDAMQWELVPIVVADACGDRHRSPHDAALFDLDSKYADVVDLCDGLAVLGGAP